MEDFEKLGVFYLGRHLDPNTAQLTSRPVLYKDRDLTTHAVVVGMTGSGKTGLGVALLEEAAIDGVGAIVIDPKGDMGNLALTFPELRPEDFAPYIDEEELRRKGTTRPEAAASLAKTWSDGLATWGQSRERIARLKAAADVVIYTPGARFGRSLSVLRSFVAPPAAMLSQPDILRERIAAAVGGLLALAGVEADPLRSREHILLCSLLEHAWMQSKDLSLPDLIRQVQTPPFSQLGVFDIETVFPAKDRLSLAMALNNLVASPGFAAWTEGEPLDVGSLLRSPGGKPRVSVLCLSHLSDAERMFFVTLLLGEVVAWMRAQPGTSSLRGLLYMDEIFGYFPPNGMPPSKRPMLTLLKQARAFGLGVVLSTQNPVDLDYKGLSNTGTWFIGRLQTERDKLRLLDGLEGAVAASGQTFDRAHLDRLLSGLGNRVFLMNNVHDNAPTLFQTRWALSFLRGPLTREQIQHLSSVGPAAGSVTPSTGAVVSPAVHNKPNQTTSTMRPVLPAGVTEFFLATEHASVAYAPSVFASGRVRYASAKLGISELRSLALTVDMQPDGVVASWAAAVPFDNTRNTLEKQPTPTATFAPLPSAATRPAAHKTWAKDFVDHLVHDRPLEVFRCVALAATSNVDESEAAFRARLAMDARQQRDELLSALHTKYADKFARAQDRVRRAEDRMSREETEMEHQSLDTALSVGASVLGALMGRRVSTGRSVRSVGRGTRQRQDVNAAAGELQAAQQALAALNDELTQKMRVVESKTDVSQLELQRVQVRAKKADVSVGVVGILWKPQDDNA